MHRPGLSTLAGATLLFAAPFLIAASCAKDREERPTDDLRCSAGFEKGDTHFQQYFFECRAGDCDDGVFCNGVETCQGEERRNVEIHAALVCTCFPGIRPCALDERCDEELDVCVPDCEFPPDEDGDGVYSIRCGGTDCDDNDPGRFPGNPELCDSEGVDEDCDPTTFGAPDEDGDGYLDDRCFNVSAGEVFGGSDCDDADPAVHRGQVEACNGVDDDCDGDVDEEVAISLYVDEDHDGFGAGAAVIGCSGRPGMAPVAGDCDDTLASITPGALRCVTDGDQQIEICGADGSWKAAWCPNQRVCYSQPGGDGVCVP